MGLAAYRVLGVEEAQGFGGTISTDYTEGMPEMAVLCSALIWYTSSSCFSLSLGKQTFELVFTI